MAEQAIPVRQKAVRGFLQGLQARKIRGWAFVPVRPDEYVRIEVRLDGQPVAAAKASLYARSLHENGIGKGDHSFVVTTDFDLPVDEPDRIVVTAKGSKGETLALRMSRKPGSATEQPVADPAPPRAAPVAPDAAAPDKDASPLTETLEATTQPSRFTATDRAHHPVFVLGSARSGTTAMCMALRKSTLWDGPLEGHLVDLLPKLLAVVAEHYKRARRDIAAETLIAHVPQSLMIDGVQNAFAEIARAVFPTGYWLDKTPGPDMIRAAPAARRIWPAARFIFMKRHPIENIESRRRKFPAMKFPEHCQLWADSMTAWETVRDELRPVSVEIEQAAMDQQPAEVAAQVTALLDLHPRQTAKLISSLVDDRPQTTQAAAPGTLTLKTVGWDAEQRDTFRRICGGPMKRFGYADVA